MSTPRANLRSYFKTVSTTSKWVRVFAVAGTYFISALALALALLTHREWPLSWREVLGVSLLCLAGLWLTGFHLRFYPVKGVSDSATGRIFWTTIFLGIAGVQLARMLLVSDVSPKGEILPMLGAPLVALGLLVSGLLGPAKGIAAATLASVACVAVEIAPAPVIVVAWLAACVGAHAVNPVRHRADFIRAAYITAFGYAVLALAFALISAPGWREVLLTMCWAGLAGFIASALSWFAIAAFEKAFGVVSDLTLLELCSPDHPVLRELVIRAPGTYAHSVMVGNLAERAATAIGANALLCRAMAYFHDIGKLKRPEFFIENKLAENPHEKLAPSLSAKIISAHVKDGLKMADDAKLPPGVRDGIAEHHGNSLISYFYHLWTREGGQDDPIFEQHFRYAGPRPRTKETAVLMLADRVEAATRTIPNATPGRMRTFVWEIIQDVRDDGQLDDSELNFRDLQTIVDAFVSSLGALRHERIDYPGADDEAPNFDTERDKSTGRAEAGLGGAE